MNTKIKKLFTAHLWIWPVLVAIILRLYKITASSIWHDEGYTMWLLKYNLPEIIERTARDVHPPGYYLMAKSWVSIFGTSEFSVRFLSLLFSVGIVYFVYLIIKDIWSEKAAFWSAMFVALSPHMIRFGQEARMYGVVAFFATLATYFFVKMIKNKDSRWLWGYVPVLLIGFYTQYYAFFVVISHWVILSFYTKGFWKLQWAKSFKEKVGIFSWRWWLANATLLLGYAWWFPKAYAQVTRVSDNYWIQPEWITIKTIPSNILHFATYTHFDAIYNWNNIFGPIFYWAVIFLAVFGALFVLRNQIKKDKQKGGALASLYVYGFLPMLLVYIISELASPIYQDRYFPFSAVAIFAIWGIAVSEIKNKYLKYGSVVIIVGTLLVGNYIMHIEVNHQMKALSSTVKTQKQEGDILVSGELYTHLDGSYYLGYGDLIFMSEPVDGYGETSLYYDQQNKYTINQDQVGNYDRVWLIGKSGKDYWNNEMWNGYKSAIYFDESGLRAVLYTKN